MFTKHSKTLENGLLFVFALCDESSRGLCRRAHKQPLASLGFFAAPNIGFEAVRKLRLTHD